MPITWIAEIEPLKVAVTPCPQGGELLDQSLRELRQAGVDVLVSMLEDHEARWLGVGACHEVCPRHGMEFVNVPIRDRGVPRDVHEVMPHAERLAAKLSEGKGVLFHCFAGIGRSPTIATCVLALLGHDVRASFARIASARRIEVPDTDEQLRFAIEFSRRATSRQRK
jgi:protein-tyrosine phosphatase